MNIKPIGKRVLLKEIEAEETTKSGLVLAGEKDDPQMAEVLAISDKVKNLAVGDKVFYKKYAGTKIKYERQEYIIIEVEDVIAQVK
ncbi:MAG: co-chaperone GroES [Tissierellia bacterium]|nr:co-chaperone GroES [Bacillota bacterium]NLL23449.1 co-chaperone GroES [Tissierellia bacterium]